MTSRATSSRDLNLAVLTDLTSVETILGEWSGLAHTSARAPLDAPDWLFPLATRYLTGYQTRVLTWRDEGNRLLGIMPLSLVSDRPGIRPVRQLATWGAIGPRLRGLVDILADEESRPAVMDGFVDWLRSSREWDVLRINRPQFGSPTPERLRAACANAGWTYAGFSNARSTTYQIELPQTVAQWDRHLKPNDRRSLLSRRRRFESSRAGVLVAAIDQSDIADLLDSIEQLLTRRWGEKEVYFRNEPRFRGLLHDAIPRLASQGDAWVSVARDLNGFVGGLVSVAQNGHAMSMLMVASPDSEYREFSLGDQIHDVAIREAVERGCHTYDLLWVGQYKKDFWRAVPRDLQGAFIGRGVIGRNAARAFARRENRVGGASS